MNISQDLCISPQLNIDLSDVHMSVVRSEVIVIKNFYFSSVFNSLLQLSLLIIFTKKKLRTPLLCFVIFTLLCVVSTKFTLILLLECSSVLQFEQLWQVPDDSLVPSEVVCSFHFQSSIT